MSNSRHTTLFCGIIAALTLALTLLLSFAKAAGAIGAITRTLGYEAKLFDTSYVHSIDIVMDADDYQSFLDTAESEEYAICSVTIDGETVKNCAIRAKGNTSLSNVKQYGNDRYSFKIEFDHYDDTLTYHGLDKLVLNNNIQDNTLMKDYLTYRMMAYMGVDAPLVSYAFITVNGEDFGLYLALEAVEESFLERNYGADYGELYKPDSISMGGGRGNGRDFDMQDFADENGLDFDFDFDKSRPSGDDSGNGGFTPPDMPSGDNSGSGGFTPPDMPSGDNSGNSGFIPPGAGNMPDMSNVPDMNGRPNMGDTPGGFGGSVDSRPMLNWIFQSEEYTALYHSIMQEFIDSFFASGEFEALIDETYALIAPYAKRDTNGFCTYAEFEQGVSTLKQFCLLRVESIQGQLDGAIPSTADGQSADSSALIDASSVTLSDMGSFGGGEAGFREQ